MGTGNPSEKVVFLSSVKVYPRGHGESGAADTGQRCTRGLSPWARGILGGAIALITLLRSIPVGTGNPTAAQHGADMAEVYPRGHGESSSASAVAVPTWGLSPWARGIPFATLPPPPPAGSIPVGTGNPTRPPLRGSSAWVYPRGHGESQAADRLAAHAGGLSPWARGIRRPRH